MNPESRKTVGVLFVHGIGEQARGETLVRCGEPLYEWLGAWSEESVRLPEAALLPDGPDPAHMVIEGRGLRLLLAEAWWANTFTAPKPLAVSAWAFTFGPRALLRHFRRVSRRFDERFRRPPPEAIRTTGDSYTTGWTRATREQLKLLMIVVSTAGLSVTTSLLWLMLLALPPLSLVPPLRPFVGRVQLFLANAIGDSYVLLRSPVRFRAMVRKVEADLCWLRERADVVAVVAHSQGAVVSHRALRDGSRDKVALFVTYGAALKLLYATEPRRRRRGARGVEELTLPGLGNEPDQLHWEDLYATSDPVSGGPLWVEPAEGQATSAVHNLASVFRDHSTYWRNGEQFVPAVVSPVVALAGAPLSAGRAADQEVLATSFMRRRHRTTLLRGARWCYLASALLALLIIGKHGLHALGEFSAEQASAALSIVFDAGGEAAEDAGSASFGRWLFGTATVLLTAAIAYAGLVVPAWKRWTKRCERAMHARNLGQGEGFSRALFIVAASLGPAALATISLVVWNVRDEPPYELLLVVPVLGYAAFVAIQVRVLEAMRRPTRQLPPLVVGEDYAVRDGPQPRDGAPSCARVRIVELGVRQSGFYYDDGIRVLVVEEAGHGRSNRKALCQGSTVVLEGPWKVWADWESYVSGEAGRALDDDDRR